jgi:hypothetical protein
LQWPEVGTILLRLSEAKTAVDVVKIAYEDFVQWLGAEDTGSALMRQSSWP